MINKMIFYFAVYSFLGWCVESVYKTILEKKFINSGFLYGPFCPIYGFGAIIMGIILEKFPHNIFIIFFVSSIILTIWEYVVGVILEKIFKTKYWDYSDCKFNINGRICLKNSIFWGILGSVFTFIAHPIVKIIVLKIPNSVLLYIDIIIYLIVLTDVVVTIVKILFMDKKINELAQISNQIKEKISELKQAKVPTENILAIIKDLKRKQSILRIKLYKLTKRLKNAFPTMQSETINKFMNQKLEIRNLKSKIRKTRGKNNGPNNFHGR